MYRIKPILGPIAVCLFFIVGTIGSAQAGALAGKKLMVDTAFEMADMAEDAVNDSVNTLAPVAAGDTVKVQLFVEDAGGVKTIGAELKFADSNMEMMFDESWKIVAVDAIIAPLGMKDAEFALATVAPTAFPENGYLGTVKILALADIKEGSSFHVKSATFAVGESLQAVEGDSLDVSEAIVTFVTPKGPSIMGMGPALMEGNMLQVPFDGSGVGVAVTLENVESEEPVVMWTVTYTGSKPLIFDAAGMMLELDEQMMLSGPTAIALQVLSGSTQVTVKANVDGEDTAPVTFTFTQLNPAELASFDGALQEEKVVLNWSTVSQTNNAGWQIMRSVDGENFESVGNFVQGAGTSDALLNYSFEDKNLPGVEKVYYRLEQVDLDGSVSRSNVIEVILGARMPLPTEFAVNVYPNPFNPSTTISYELPEGAPVTVVIYDVLGQQVRHLISQFNSAGRYQVQWDARDNQGRGVASGVYIAKINAGTSTLSQKMLLLK